MRASFAVGVVAALLVASGAAAAVPAFPVDAGFDYQIGGDYPLPGGVRVVARDWFEGTAPDDAFAICYVNAFQTQDDEPAVARPDERSAWPPGLVLDRLGDDPEWGGEYLVDISTGAKRRRAADWLQPMIETCAEKGFEAVEYDNLDSWTRFDGTPRADDVPFEKPAAVAFAALIASRAHDLGLSVGQKNTAELTRVQARRRIGFDFAIVEECGRYRECERYRAVYGNRIVAIEYRRVDFRRSCGAVGRDVAVVLRDRAVSVPGSRGYRFARC